MPIVLGPARNKIVADYLESKDANDLAWWAAQEEEERVWARDRATHRDYHDQVASDRRHADRLRQIDLTYRGILARLLEDRDAKLRAIDNPEGKDATDGNLD